MDAPHIELEIKVVPGAGRDEVSGWLGDALKVRVTAPPEKGKANGAVVRLLAKTLGVPRDAVVITSGHASPRKRVSITGCDAETVRSRVEACLR